MKNEKNNFNTNNDIRLFWIRYHSSYKYAYYRLYW